jgi:hypothetical protein
MRGGRGDGAVRRQLLKLLESRTGARLFQWQADTLYTKWESELIQQHPTRYGEAPSGGEEELDDLF